MTEGSDIMFKNNGCCLIFTYQNQVSQTRPTPGISVYLKIVIPLLRISSILAIMLTILPNFSFVDKFLSGDPSCWVNPRNKFIRFKTCNLIKHTKSWSYQQSSQWIIDFKNICCILNRDLCIMTFKYILREQNKLMRWNSSITWTHLGWPQRKNAASYEISSLAQFK